MRLFDTHAHYCDERFNGRVDECLKRAFDAGVECIVTCPSTVDDTAFSRDLAEKYDKVYFASGIHPEVCGDFSLEHDLPVIESFLAHPKCVAVGECGLDYYWPQNPPRDIQKAWFEAQCKLALKHNLPLIIHDREAHGDTFEILKKYRPRGVLHCYSGSAEMAREYTKMGFYISFGGVLTFPNTQKVHEAFAAVPPDKLMLETDCPYLAPVPKRGKTNESAFMAHTAAFAAELLGISPDELAAQTTENAYRFFGINK